ncbi:hypothetical protein QUF78_23880 [Peribacillus sp. ACCC06369]|nr:hypothetical protein [Peribacillus sp. ACCC06369]
MLCAFTRGLEQILACYVRLLVDWSKYSRVMCVYSWIGANTRVLCAFTRELEQILASYVRLLVS